MGQRRHQPTKSHTLPSSPTHSSSSSDFEFTISASPRKSSAAAAALCPADELFYKGQLLPLHLSPRISMVRHLLLSSASTSDTSTTTSRDSTASTSSTSSAASADLLHHHLDSDSSGRPSSAAADDEFKRLTSNNYNHPRSSKPSKYFSLPKFSSVFRPKNAAAAATPSSGGAAAVRRVSSSAKEVIRKYLKKVKPLYEKLSQKQKTPPPATAPQATPPPPPPSSRSATTLYPKENIRRNIIPLSFSGNLKLYSMNRVGSRSCISSCPSSMGSSPTHSKSAFGFRSSQTGRIISNGSDASSMEELQSAIQGAIAHCKNSMNKTMVSNEV